MSGRVSSGTRRAPGIFAFQRCLACRRDVWIPLCAAPASRVCNAHPGS